MNINRRTNVSPAPMTQQQYTPPQPQPQQNNYTRQQTAPVRKGIQHDTDV